MYMSAAAGQMQLICLYILVIVLLLLYIYIIIYKGFLILKINDYKSRAGSKIILIGYI